MKFLSQLKLLIWKNFTLRKRHTTRNIIEIVWPLVLFFILVAVRSRRQPSAIPNKYYRPRAMPSAGMIPFIQSFLCDFRGEGLNYSDVIQSDLPNLQGSSFARFLEDAFPLIRNSTLRDRVLRLNQDYQKYVGDERQWMDLLNQYQNANNITNLLLSNVLNDSAGFQEFLINQTGFSPQVAQQLLNAKLNMQQVDQIVQVLSIPNIGAGGIGMLAGLASILRNMGGSQLQMINWVVNNYQLVQRILQGQNLTGGDVKKFVCDDSSPVAIDKLIQLNQGSMTEVKSAICSLDNAKLLNLANELRKQIRVPGMSNTTAGPNLLELQRRLTKDLQDLSQDEMAVRSFERVLSDYMELARIMQSSGGNFNDVICSGRWSRGTSSNNSSGWQQSLQSGLSVGSLAAATARNYTQVSCLTNVRRYYPGYLKQLDSNTAGKSLDQCALIYPPARVDCGWPGMKPSDCAEMGCCFDSSVKHAYYCFYPPRKAECGCLIGLATRRASGVTGNTQRAAFDRGFVQLAQLFLKGEILYTPDNPTTRDIINKVKSELSDLGLIEQFAAWWVNNSDAIRQSVMNASQIYQNVMELSRNLSETVNATVRQNLMNLTRRINVPGLGDFERLADMSSMLSPLANGNNSRMNLSLLFDSIDEIFRDVVSIYKCIQHEYFVGYSDEDSLVRRAVNTSQTPVIASLVFENLNDDEVPKHVKYKIRQDIDFTPRTDRIRGWYWRPGPRDGFGSNSYLNFGFVFLQDLIERALSSAILNETIFEPGIYLQPFPYPCYISDRFVWYISGPMPLLMTLAWIYSVAMIIKGIVYEKERRLTEVMKVMGLGRTVHWCAWFINSSIIMLITIFLLVITMKFGNILQNSNPFIVIIFLVVFMISTIMMCFLISVFFSRANVAAACGGIIFFVTYLPYSLVRWYEAFMTTSQKAAACLSSTTAFGLACTYFARYEEQGVGVQWSNFYSSPIEGDGFSLGYALTMMMVDALLYGILTWYIEAIRPGQYGIPKPWYFPFLKSYWFPDNLRSGQQSSHDSSTSTHYQSGRSGSVGFDRNTASGMDEVHIQNEEQNNEDVAVESEPSHLPLGVSIQGLVKIYKEGNKLAVDGLNLNLYEGQITSFLGHNGAGKTTTMSILTGLYSPTSGTAMISGKDIRSDMDVIRKSLGMCPQYNVLFDQLTVEEHLWFYSSLKGMTKSNIPAEIEKFLKDIGLEHKRHELAANLSGGMKRKLSVAMAFIAGSKVVILDEPTAGVDPYARRGIWDLLLKYKEGRTILLSTHHMDEADVLGDRVAIISQGKLQCCGSSLFLKGHYGNGYYLTLTKRTPGERPSTAGTLRDVKLKLEDLTETNSSSTDEGVFLDSLDAGSERDSLGSSNSDSLPLNNTDVYCSENTVSSFIKNHIPTAQLVEHVGSELTYVLPTEAAKEGKFQDMFDDLDRNLGRLHVGSYGVSDTTLEEVFLKVAEDAIDEEADKFAAEVPKRRFSFRHHLFSKSRVRDSLSDKCDLLDCMEEEHVDKETDNPTDTVDGEEGSFDIDRKSTGLKLILRQFWALVVKRFHHSRRNRKGFASQIILPAIFVCLAMIVAQIRPFYEMPPIELSTKMFQDSEPYKHYLMFSKDDLKDQLAKNLSETFLNYPGVGTACIDGSCPKGPINFEGAMTPPSNSSPDCSCASGIPVCPAGAGGPTPRQWKSYSGDILQNMTGRNVADHLLKTYHDYVKKRYGVVTFGDNLRNLPDNIRLAQDPATKRLATAQNTKAWYNNKGYHAMPTFLNVLSNNILRAKAKDKGYDPTQFGISVTNHPMNYTKEQLNDQTIIKRAVDVLVAICVVFALSFVPASFVVFLVNERASKGKHLHLVSGVRPYVYWIANYFWDMCNYLIPAMLCVLIFLAFNDESYTSAMNFPPTLCLLLLYGWAITPLMYPASYLFTVSSTAYIVLICLNLFIGVNCTLATFILELFQDDQELTDINDILKVIFLVFPNYCLGRGLIDLAKNQFLGIFDRFGQNLVRPAFSWDITGRNILAMIIQGFLFFFINVLIEYRFFYKPKPIMNANTQLAEEDDDVKRERQRVVNGAGSCTDAMRLVNLTKVFKVRKTTNVAVNQLCVGVSKGECFGLLGVNGAGKTTTFKMLTGDIHVTSGEAYVNGYSVLSDIHAAHQTMGYCPQFDALDDLLTAKEHLYLYSRLRGVPEDQIEKVVKNLIQKMNLTQYQDVCAGKYSGGNKRKLSTAIALVGNPAIVFMDEPTTGMDPKARRFLWNIITGIVKEGRTVILTSHSMEECEALCNRVAIMVNGQFKCLGSPQHLKNKYGDGYTVVLKVAGPNPQTEQVSEFIKTIFPNAILKDQHLNMLEYQLPSQGLSVSKLFGHLEANRKIFDIEDYSVSQTTLDQVFINFAKDQTDGMDELQVTRHPPHNMELRTMRYTHLIEGDEPELTVDV